MLISDSTPKSTNWRGRFQQQLEGLQLTVDSLGLESNPAGLERVTPPMPPLELSLDSTTS